jgi:hypothetical protein
MKAETTTTRELASRWTGQGSVLIRLVASFSYGSLAEWRSMVEGAGVPILSSDRAGPDGPDVEVNLSALPDNISTGSLYLTLQTHPHKDSPAHWVFEWQLSPNSEPPAEIRTQSKAAGGYAAVLHRVSQSFPEGAALDAKLTAAFVLNETVWGRSSLVKTIMPGRAAKRVETKLRTLELRGRSDSWQIAPPSGAVERLKLTWSTGEASRIILTAEVSGKKTLNPRERWLPGLADALWQDIKPLLSVQSKSKK